jgi:hypothetical protein
VDEHTTMLPRVGREPATQPAVPAYELRRRAGAAGGDTRRGASRRLWAGVSMLVAVGVLVAGGVAWLQRDRPEGGGAAGSGGDAGSGAGGATAWVKIAGLPQPLEAGAVASFKGRVWVAGGVSPEEGRPFLTDVQVFDPRTRRWSDGPALPVGTSHAALVATDDTLFVVGGLVKEGATARVLRLSRNGTAWEEGAPLPAPRGAGAAAGDGSRIVFAGGVRPDHAVADEVWSLEGDKWALLGKLQRGREKLAAATDGFGTVWFLAGRDPGEGENGLVDVVSRAGVSAADKQVQPLAAPGGLYIPGAGVCLVGGQRGDGFSDQAECLNADKSATVPRLGTPRAGLGVAVVDGVVYAVGGYGDGFHGSSTAEALTTETP